ncbi:MAG: LptF/LptG family permease [Candidatus Omnitrophica bacterium]|nr:LptF/LptG family permease [Candidatus Omnitrophota bacterium]
MRILDNYITKSVVRIFISAILLFCFLYILIDLAMHLDDFFTNKVPMAVIRSYYISFFPLIFVQTSPIACLLATLFTYSTLNNNNEIIALRSSGMDFWKITRPAIIFSVMIAAFVFMVQEKFVPQSASLSQDIKKDTIDVKADNRSGKPQPVKNLYFYGMDNRLFYIDEYDPATRTMKSPTIITQDSRQRLTEKLVALKGEWTGSSWKFTSCQIATYNPLDQIAAADVHVYTEKTVNIGESPSDLMKQHADVTTMNIHQLREYIKRFKSSGAEVALRGLRVDLNQKIAYPFACIVIIFVGLPFALMTGNRKGLTFASVGIALAIGFLFFVVNSIGLAFGKLGAFPPAVAAWFAPILFLIAGVLLIRRMF